MKVLKALFLSCVLTCLAIGCSKPAVAELKPLERIQLERLAYFCADSRLSVPGKPVLNRTVTLKDSWAKA